MLGPPLLIGEKIFYSKDGNNVVPGTVKWLGKILECFGNQMVAGLALVRYNNEISSKDIMLLNIFADFKAIILHYNIYSFYSRMNP